MITEQDCVVYNGTVTQYTCVVSMLGTVFGSNQFEYRPKLRFSQQIFRSFSLFPRGKRRNNTSVRTQTFISELLLIPHSQLINHINHTGRVSEHNPLKALLHFFREFPVSYHAGDAGYTHMGFSTVPQSLRGNNVILPQSPLSTSLHVIILGRLEIIRRTTNLRRSNTTVPMEGSLKFLSVCTHVAS